MVDQLKGQHWLYQEMVVSEILEKFGEEFVYYNENGNLAISRPVLREFRKLTEGTVVWERSARAWRPREGHDPEGRQVD
jgi:Family of unknown function (DUF6953)